MHACVTGIGKRHLTSLKFVLNYTFTAARIYSTIEKEVPNKHAEMPIFYRTCGFPLTYRSK